jgi:hypothetical protein
MVIYSKLLIGAHTLVIQTACNKVHRYAVAPRGDDFINTSELLVSVDTEHTSTVQYHNFETATLGFIAAVQLELSLETDNAIDSLNIAEELLRTA